MKVYAANPSELQIIENPTKRKKMAARKRTPSKKTTTRRRNPSKTMVSQVTDIAGPAASVIVGQAVGTKATQLLLMQLGKAPSNVRKFTATGFPIVIGVLMMMSKNKYVQSAGVGSASSGLLYALKTALPTISTVPLAGDMAGFLADNNLDPEDQFISDEAGNVYDSEGNFLYNTAQLSGDDDDSMYLSDDDDSGYLSDEEEDYFFAGEEEEFDYV